MMLYMYLSLYVGRNGLPKAYAKEPEKSSCSGLKCSMVY